MNVPNYSIYVKLMIDGSPSKPFSAATLHPATLHPATLEDSRISGA